MSTNPTNPTNPTTESSLYKVYIKINSTRPYDPYPPRSFEVYTEATSDNEAIEKTKLFFDIPTIMMEYYDSRGEHMVDSERLRKIYHNSSWKNHGILSVEQKEIEIINILREIDVSSDYSLYFGRNTTEYDKSYRNNVSLLSESKFNKIRDYLFSQLICEKINLNVVTKKVVL